MGSRELRTLDQRRRQQKFELKKMSKFSTLLVLAAAAVVAVNAWGSCDDCKDGMKGIFDVLQNQAVVDEELELFKDRFCDINDDKCQLFLMNWGDMQRAWLGDASTVQGFCTDVNMCESRAMRLTGDEDTCNRCKTGISAIAADMAHPSVRVRTVNMLKGPAYCGQVNLAFCQQLVDTFVPQAMAVMAEELPENQLEICQAYNVCQ